MGISKAGDPKYSPKQAPGMSSIERPFASKYALWPEFVGLMLASFKSLSDSVLVCENSDRLSCESDDSGGIVGIHIKQPLVVILLGAPATTKCWVPSVY